MSKTIRLDRTSASSGRGRMVGNGTDDLIPVSDRFGIYPGSIKLYALDGEDAAEDVDGIDVTVDVDTVHEADVGGSAGAGKVSDEDEARAMMVASYATMHGLDPDEAEAKLVEAGTIEPRADDESPFDAMSDEDLRDEVADTVPGIGTKGARKLSRGQLIGLLEG